mmetsp:Transcript_189/g.237  ORF Transcript_189/g.237 Transcript_189/m.237 type:complete len:95 (+) Transcript_189:174-458(+)
MMSSSLLSNFTRKAVQSTGIGLRTRAAQRFATTSAQGAKEKTWKDAWLSDPGAYPVIGIISTACVIAAGFGVKFMATSPDVQINKDVRKSIMRV